MVILVHITYTPVSCSVVFRYDLSVFNFIHIFEDYITGIEEVVVA